VTIQEALRFVVNNGNGYAAAYASEMLRQVQYGYPDHDQYVQALYVLNNFGNCRVNGHKEVRQTIKDYRDSKK